MEEIIMTKKAYIAPNAEAVNFDAGKSFAETLAISQTEGSQQLTRGQHYEERSSSVWNSEIWAYGNEE